MWHAFLSWYTNWRNYNYTNYLFFNVITNAIEKEDIIKQRKKKINPKGIMKNYYLAQGILL